MAYLVKTVETYRVANEKEASAMIKDAQTDPKFVLSKYNSEYKCTKTKGEVDDEWYRVTLTKEFNAEKEPSCLVDISYSKSEGFFPSPVDNDEEDEDEY